ITTPLVIEGLTNDSSGNLYAPGRTPGAGLPCPVWRIPLENPTLTIVGLVPAPSATGQCSPSGLAFGPDGMLYVTETDRIYRFTPNAATPPTAVLFASNVPGTNGLAFDWTGELWTGDGTTGQGRVWKISDTGQVTEMFRVPPMANEVTLPSGTVNVGRDVRSLPPGTITVTSTSRNASNTLGSQPLVANGVAFDMPGNLYVADTARGAIWKVPPRAVSGWTPTNAMRSGTSPTTAMSRKSSAIRSTRRRCCATQDRSKPRRARSWWGINSAPRTPMAIAATIRRARLARSAARGSRRARSRASTSGSTSLGCPCRYQDKMKA